MEFLKEAMSFLLHLDRHLGALIQDYGAWTYAILWGIIFAETGLVVAPLLPGDSLLFAAGALSATGALSCIKLYILLVVAAILGDSFNYQVGRWLGAKAAEGRLPLVNREHIERTHRFYEKYGAKTIILARFVPIVRTFAPFVAGAGSMSYGKFLSYNVLGAIAWVTIFLLGGFYFGNLPFVKKNFSVVILAIIVLSVLPAVVEYLRARRERTA